MELLLLTRGERVALLCVFAAALYASPLLLPSTSSSLSLLHQADALPSSASGASTIARAASDNYNLINYITHGTIDNDNTSSSNREWDFVHIYDDRTNFVDNPVLQPRDGALFSWRNLLAMTTMCRINVYEPLGWLLKALVVRVAGFDAWAVRIATLALHLCAGFALAWASALVLEVDDVASRLASKLSAGLDPSRVGTNNAAPSGSVHSGATAACGAAPRRASAGVPTDSGGGSNGDSFTDDDDNGVGSCDFASGNAVNGYCHDCKDDEFYDKDDESYDRGGDNRVSRGASPAAGTGECAHDAARAHRCWLGCCLSALLYTVHPVHVEVVGWPSAQPYALAALFANLSLCAYVHGAKRALLLVDMSECGCERKRERESKIIKDAPRQRPDPPSSSVSPSLVPSPLVVSPSVVSSPLVSQVPSLSPSSQYLSSMGSGLQSRDCVVAGLYLCSVLSKSAGVLLPAAFVLVDALVLLRLRLRRRADRVRWRSTRVVVLLARYAAQKRLVLMVLAAFVGVTLWSNGEDWEDMLSLSLGERVAKALAAPAWVARCVLWPSELRVHYQLREHELALTAGSPECVLSLAALALWVLLGVWRWCRRASPQLLLATAYTLVMLMPTSGIVPHGIVSRGGDRYAYLPSAVAVPFGGYAFARRLFGGGACRVHRSEGGILRHTQRSERCAWPCLQEEHVPEQCQCGEPEDESACVESSSSAICCGRERSRSQRRAAAVVFGAALFALLLLSAKQLGTWRNEQTLYAHSLSIDPTDWRMYSWLAKALSNSSPPACDSDPQRCKRLWQLARHFAPTRSLAAQLFRTKVLVPLGEFDLACDVYEQLLQAHPESPPVLSNASVCRLLRGAATIDETRALLVRAAHAPIANRVRYAQHIIEANLKIFDAWATVFQAKHGDREPTPAERATFDDWILM